MRRETIWSLETTGSQIISYTWITIKKTLSNTQKLGICHSLNLGNREVKQKSRSEEFIKKQEPGRYSYGIWRSARSRSPEQWWYHWVPYRLCPRQYWTCRKVSVFRIPLFHNDIKMKLQSNNLSINYTVHCEQCWRTAQKNFPIWKFSQASLPMNSKVH